MITLDDTDQTFVTDTLTDCIAILGMRMTDPNICQANRVRAMEYHRMALKAREIVKGTKDEGK